MKLAEKIIIVLALVGTLFKLFLVSGGGLIVVVSYTALSTLYFYFGFALFNNIRLRHVFKKESYVGVSSGRIIGGIAMGISFSICLIGMLFKVQYWPGEGVMLMAGMFTGVLVLIPSIFKFLKNREEYYKKALVRGSVLVGISTILFLTPARTLVELQYRNHPRYIEAYIEYQKDPMNQELSDKLWIEYSRATMSPEEFKHFMENEFEGVDYDE